jgi:hypothetical protein
MARRRNFGDNEQVRGDEAFNSYIRDEISSVRALKERQGAGSRLAGQTKT